MFETQLHLPMPLLPRVNLQAPLQPLWDGVQPTLHALMCQTASHNEGSPCNERDPHLLAPSPVPTEEVTKRFEASSCEPGKK